MTLTFDTAYKRWERRKERYRERKAIHGKVTWTQKGHTWESYVDTEGPYMRKLRGRRRAIHGEVTWTQKGHTWESYVDTWTQKGHTWESYMDTEGPYMGKSCGHTV
jgi:hypothetical protein